MRFKPFLSHHEKKNGFKMQRHSQGLKKCRWNYHYPKVESPFTLSHTNRSDGNCYSYHSCSVNRFAMILPTLLVTFSTYLFGTCKFNLHLNMTSFLLFSIWLQLYFIALVDERTIKMISVFEERYFLSLLKMACDWKRRHSYLTPTQISCTI